MPPSWTSVRTTALVMLLVTTASAFSYLMTLCRVPALLAGVVTGI